MKHAYHGRADQRIQLEADAFPGRVSIRLHHLGDSFDPAAVSPPALDGSRESGFGIYLITKSVDEVRYSRDERGRNCIALVKVLNVVDAKDNAMQIAFEKVGDVAVAAVPVEELDASNAGEFKRDIAPVLDANTKLVLDLSPPALRRQLRTGRVHFLPPEAERQGRRPEAVRHVEAGASGVRARAHAPGLRHPRHQGGRGARVRARADVAPESFLRRF